MRTDELRLPILHRRDDRLLLHDLLAVWLDFETGSCVLDYGKLLALRVNRRSHRSYYATSSIFASLGFSGSREARLTKVADETPRHTTRLK